MLHSTRRIPGNERIISVWPVRTGVLVHDKLAFCCAGIFPEQGTYEAALNVQTGKIVARQKLAISPQGYLARKGDRLFVTTGRNPAGAFVAKNGKITEWRDYFDWSSTSGRFVQKSFLSLFKW